MATATTSVTTSVNSTTTNHTTIDDSNNNNSDSTPQRRLRRSSLKKGCQRVTAGQGESRRVLFARSRSLSEHSPVWSSRDSSAEGRDGPSYLCRVR